jgi:hypothetical protein
LQQSVTFVDFGEGRRKREEGRRKKEEGRRKRKEGRGEREVKQKEGSFPGSGQERRSARLCLVKQEANGSRQALPGKAGGTSLRAGERAYKLPTQSRIKLAGGHLSCCGF